MLRPLAPLLLLLACAPAMAVESCDHCAPDISLTPTLTWQQPDLADVSGWKLLWRYSDETTWHLAAYWPKECFTHGRCWIWGACVPGPGLISMPVPLQRYLKTCGVEQGTCVQPGALIDVTVVSTRAGGPGESPQPTTVECLGSCGDSGPADTEPCFARICWPCVAAQFPIAGPDDLPECACR